MLFKNPEQFLKMYEYQEPIDKKKFVFEGQSPAFHTNENCDKILSNFYNIKLPERIKAEGHEKIEEFRLWFKENYDLFIDKPDIFVERMRLRFKLEEKIEAVDYKNSGVDMIENLNLLELDKKIENLIEKSYDYINSSQKIKVILENFAQISFIHKEKKSPYNNPTRYSNEEIWAVLKEFDERFKTPIIFLLREYYKVKYNPNLAFEGKLLQQLGFNHCTSCQNKEFVREYEQSMCGLYTVENNTDLKIYLKKDYTFILEDMDYPSLTIFMIDFNEEERKKFLKKGENPFASKVRAVGIWRKENQKIIFDKDISNSDDHFDGIDYALIKNYNLECFGHVFEKAWPF